MHIATLPNPVTADDRYGGDQLNTHLLREFCNRTTGNFHTIATELEMHRLKFMDIHAQNTKLVQFMNWLAVTNPQILDEFQATSNAFEKLSPRDYPGHAETTASP